MISFMLIVACVFFTSNLWAEAPCSRADVETAVNEAVATLETDGQAGLAKVGAMSFCGENYVFVNDLDGKTLMHKMSHLIGKVLIGLKDDKGKRFFADFTKAAQSSQKTLDGKAVYTGSGWVSYRWPKPGEKTFSPKVTYIKACMMGDENVYVGAGIYE